MVAMAMVFSRSRRSRACLLPLPPADRLKRSGESGHGGLRPADGRWWSGSWSTGSTATAIRGSGRPTGRTSRSAYSPAASTQWGPDVGESAPSRDTRLPQSPPMGAPSAMDKVFASPEEAVADIRDGASLAVGGFGLCGVPIALIDALLAQGTHNLTTISNNCGVDDQALGVLLYAGRITRTISSFVGGNKELARLYLSGELEVELTPQGTLAERLRAGGVGVPAFYTPTGVGTMVAEGGIPIRYDAEGNVVQTSEPKEVRVFDGEQYVLETALVADFALVRAAVADRHGNLVFRESAGNFNAPAGMAGRITIAEVEELVEPGEIKPEHVHLPGVFVDRVVVVSAEDKKIEKRTTRPPTDSSGTPAAAGEEASA